MEVFDFDPSAPWNIEKEFVCPICDKPVDKEGPCSNSCFEADMR